MNMRKGFFCALLILSLLFSSLTLSSCTPEKKQTAEDHIAFCDALGRQISVQKHPKRVAALLGSFADVWLLAGGDLCAAPEDAWEDFGFESESAVNLGGAHSPNLELLISSSPDLVLASASTASNVEMKDTLEAVGIAVVYFNIVSFEDYLYMLDFCTDLTGKKELYEANGSALCDRINEVKESYANADFSEKERKVLVLRVSSGKVKAKGSRGTVLGEMLSDMGCTNIADNERSLLENLSIEAVMREEPYHIFAVAMGDDLAAAEASLDNLLKENPAWSSLDAVMCGRVHMMDKTLFNLKPNDRFAEAYETLYEVLIEKKN